MYKLVSERYLNYNDFSTDPTDNVWIFSSPSDIEFLQKNEKLPNKVGSMAIVQNGIVTNKDVLYIVKVFNDKNLTIPYYGKHTDKQKIVYFEYNGNVSDIESTILHRCVKESKYNGMIDNTYIIFPYKTKQSTRFFLPNNTLIESGYEPLSEEEIKKEFPLAYNYLLAIYDKLSVRDMDKNIAWFLYGRTQGLANSCFKKIVFKHIVKKKTPLIVPYILDDDVIVYSGMYTTIAPDLCISPKSKSNNNDYIFNDKKYDFLLRKVYDIFSSPEFARYCSLRGKDKLGGYVELSTKMVKSFGISPTTLKTPKISVDISQIKIPIVDFKKNIPDYPDL
jgi:adenine-specific DNA-methyltransferase